MKFTYEAYINLIKKLKEEGYNFTDYKNYNSKNKNVILRHDIDNSLEKALEIAKIEKELEVKAYYFVLLSTDFYNIMSEKSLKIIHKIVKLGGKIGLHFDEKKYKIYSQEEYIKYIQYEIEILEKILGIKIEAVSMHRPSSEFLEMNLEIPNIINSYQKKYFKEFKYLSDSRMHWRENILEAINSGNYNNLHILIHPFWYSEINETMKEKLKKYFLNASNERYQSLKENFRDLDAVILEGEIYE